MLTRDNTMKFSSLTLLLLSLAAPIISMAGQADAPLMRNADRANGERLFASCAACHGPDASGRKDGSVPALAGQHWQVLTKLLLDFRYFRRWDSRMANTTASDHLRGPQEIADVVAYISSLPPRRAQSTGTGEHLQRGAQVYALRCASCHGREAQGSGSEGYPALAAQQYAYLVRQIRDGREGTRPTFSADHIRVLRELTPTDIDAVADHLARLELHGVHRASY
jgi:cbb3-type cytochrome c oxidase subunit III